MRARQSFLSVKIIRSALSCANSSSIPFGDGWPAAQLTCSRGMNGTGMMSSSIKFSSSIVACQLKSVVNNCLVFVDLTFRVSAGARLAEGIF